MIKITSANHHARQSGQSNGFSLFILKKNFVHCIIPDASDSRTAKQGMEIINNSVFMGDLFNFLIKQFSIQLRSRLVYNINMVFGSYVFMKPFSEIRSQVLVFDELFHVEVPG